MTAVCGIWILLSGQVGATLPDSPWQLQPQNAATPAGQSLIVDPQVDAALRRLETYDPYATRIIRSTLDVNRSNAAAAARRFPTTPVYTPPPANNGQPQQPAHGYYTPPPLGSGPVPPPAYGPQGPYSSRQLSTSRVSSMQGHLPQMPTALPAKPFSDYTPPPPLSHYDLYRYDNDFSLVNRYMAAPLARQQQFMNQTRANVQDLQTATRYQQQNLQQLDRRTQPAHGTSAPGYFMNFRQYYPGFGQ
jgi:hypothetical protein